MTLWLELVGFNFLIAFCKIGIWLVWPMTTLWFRHR